MKWPSSNLILPVGLCLSVTVALLFSYRLRREQQDEGEQKRTVNGRLTLEQEMLKTGGQLIVKPIGKIHSIYRLCVGTPRQGLLAPHARGRIELFQAADVVDGLDSFSHIWIIFVFHLNTQGTRSPSKIAPPALGGRKLGVYATRSPHRANPVGITLAKIDKIETATKLERGKLRPCTYIYISGLDLVDGTPVLDIKPYVSLYDAPIHDDFSLPDWVSGGLSTKRNVRISKQAHDDLEQVLYENPSALEFYAAHEINEVIACIEEVLAIDVRSQWQTKKVREGKSQAQRAGRLKNISSTSLNCENSICTQQIDNLLVHFTVEESTRTEKDTSKGSGAEDSVFVTSIQLLS